MLNLSAKVPPAAATRPEDELLLCCARTRIDSANAEQIKTLIREDLDWAYLLQKAIEHGTMPLLYQSLNATCPEAVPQAILGELQDYFFSLAGINLFLTGKLLTLLNLFKAHGISAIPFKGPVLAVSVYGNLALRHFSDLDLLVRSQDFLRAENLLIAQRYQVQLQLGWQSSFVHVDNDDNRVNVDLHQAFTPRHFPLPLDFERLWDRLQPVSIAGMTVLSLLPEDCLLILCVQFARDFWERRERLAQICDISELIRIHKEMDWELVIKQASTLGSKRILFLGLFLARELLGTALPQEVLQRIHADPVVKSLTIQVSERLFYQDNKPPKIFDSSLLFYFRVRERLQDFVLPLIRPNENDRMFLPLPPFFSCLYYPLRALRLVSKYGLILLKYL